MSRSKFWSSAKRFAGFHAWVLAALAGCGGDIGTANSVPVAVADLDADMNDGSYCLSGRSSSDDDGTVVAWQWDYLSGPVVPGEALIDGDAGLCLSVERVDPAIAFYAYRLTVTDDRGQDGDTTVRAWIPEVPSPLQGIGAEISATAAEANPGDRLGLQAEVFAGEFPCNAALCSWEQVAGPAAFEAQTTQCVAGASVAAELDVPAAQGEADVLGFRFTVRDDVEPGCESRYYVAVTVRPQP
jgi:hypothetical protein